VGWCFLSKFAAKYFAVFMDYLTGVDAALLFCRSLIKIPEIIL
jgi:hypothetical protein